MATKEELIETFRKETEDLVQANVRSIYNTHNGEDALVVGTTIMTFSEDPYDNADSYEIYFDEAKDSSGVDIIDAISVSEKTGSGFKVLSPREGTLRWHTNLKTPNFNFWT